MKKYGTLRNFIETNNIELSKLEVRTSDTLYLGCLMATLKPIEHLLDNEMYHKPVTYTNGVARCYVQD